MNIRNIIICSFTLLICGCSVLEKVWLVPHTSKTIEIPKGISQADILDIFKEASLNHFLKFQKAKVTYRDSTTLEVGNWRKSNLPGYSGKAELNLSKQTLRFTIKGANIYYGKLQVVSDSGDEIWVDTPVEYTANSILKAMKVKLER